MAENASTISIDALKAGDREAFASFVDLTSAQIYRVISKILDNPQDAEDVLQDTYLKAFRSLPGFEGRSSLSTWLYRIAVNEALMHLRKSKAVSLSLDEPDPDGDADSDTMDVVDWCCLPEGDYLTAEAREFLDDAIQRLPTTLKLVFIMRDIEGLSIQETAEALGLNEGVVKTRLLRARLRLREDLAGYFGGKIGKDGQR